MELATGTMGSLLLKLGELVKQEYSLQKGVKQKIQKLTRELEAAHAVLRKIGDVPPDKLDELVRHWASEVREASYDMEDIVDTFLVRVEDDPNEPTEPHMLRRLRKKVGKLFKKSKARRNISSLIDEINEKLEEVAARRGRYTLDNIATNLVAANTIDPRILNLYKRATELVGIERPRDELIKKLSLEDGDVDLSGTTKMKILSIFGFGGLGKTTLAKAVYDQLKTRFECWAFVPVGQNPDVKKVFRDILIALDEKNYTHPKLEGLDPIQLLSKLNEFVKKKRCLIVIDDIWDMETWKLVRCALQESNCGSRLVITTRISEVATYAGEAYKMQPLSHDDSKKLLYARIADGEGKYFDTPSAEACENFLKKCGGVPLAIITIASLLASKPGEDWSEVYNSIGFGNQGNGDVDTTRKILSFSYYDLPSHLKSCLLYLSVFPEDHVIEKNSLIWMWMAEGFFSEEHVKAAGVGPFELGERFFNELINRSMIQSQEKEHVGYVDACSVHDMVLDLIHQLSSEENFVTVLNGGGQQKLQGSISRRLALPTSCVQKHNTGHLDNVGVGKLRSIFAGDCEFCALCPHLPFLRVANIEQCSCVYEGHEKGVLDHLGSLLHLRYLTVDTFTKLPREVRFLRFLQTLDLHNSVVGELPEELGLLTQLVCLRVDCEFETSGLAGLIGKLTSLQELRVRCDKDEGATMQFVKELGLLKELRVLETVLFVISESIESSLLESLGHLNNIRELQIVYNCDVDFDIMNRDAGWVSCGHLRFLYLQNSMVFYRLPAWAAASAAAAGQHLILSCQVLNPLSLRSLKDKNLHLGFDKMLGFQNLGTSSLQTVQAIVNCEGAGPREVEEAEAALKHAAAAHPKHPTLQSYKKHENDMLSRYQEACMEMSRAPELVIKAWKLADIVGSKDIQIMCMAHSGASSSKVIRLLYTDNGVALLALRSNAIHMLWKWDHGAKNPHGKPSNLFPPVLWQLENGILLKNHTTYGNNPEEATACTALSRDDEYLISASGRKVSLYNMKTFKVGLVFMAPLAVTFLAFHPNDNYTVAIGWEDSSIHIYNYIYNRVKVVLTGHKKKITGLAFSKSMELLVSSGADGQLCVWSIDDWENKKSRHIKHPSNGSSALVGDTMVQFHYDEMHLLVVHESQLAIYDWQLECLCLWYPRDPLPAPISSAVYSLGCLMVYSGFRDGAIGIFKAESLTLQCRIAPSAYIPSLISSRGETVYPTAVATHPRKPNQIAVGLSDGAVLVLEPLDTDDVQVCSNTDIEQCPPNDANNTAVLTDK